MATIGTTTIADSLAPPGAAPITRRFITTNTYHYYAAVRTATDTLTIYRSTDNGASFGSYASFTHTGLQEWSSIIVDSVGYLHLAYRVGTATLDTAWYRRLNLSTGAFTGGLQVSGNLSNSGTPGSRLQGVDLVVFRNPDSSFAIMVATAYSEPATPRHGLYLQGVSIEKNAGAIYLNNGIITGTRSWFVNGTPTGRSGVSLEVEHNGDGFTTSTPNVWVTWGRASVRVVKVTWKSSSVGWQGPSGYQTLRMTMPSGIDYTAGRWDGAQWLVALPGPDDTTTVRVYQRNKANSQTTIFDSPTHPTGVVRNCAVSYDNTTKNIRVFAVGTSTAVLYYVDYVRASSSWTSWATVSATAVLGATEWGVSRGGTAGAARHELVLGAAGSPNTYSNVFMSASTAPAVSSFLTSGLGYTNGSAANVGATLPLSWTFSDLDPGQTQGSYALSRQIGAGALAYWNATTSSWGASEVQNTSATQGVTLPTAWGVDGDSPHQYKVKVWDSTGTVAPGYSDALQLYPSAQVNPTVTAPTGGGTINTDQVTVTWSVAEQTGIRAVLAQTSPVAAALYDSGPLMGYTDTSFTLPPRLPNGYGYTLTFYTYNADGLISAPTTRAFTVSYAAPAAATPVLTAVPASGWMQVAVGNPTPVGVQPTVIDQDLWRRVKTTAALNTNPTFAGSVTGWQTGGGGGAGTLSYSTAQFVSSPGAARMVPSGTVAVPVVESSLMVPFTAGQLVVASGWIRPDTGNKPVRVTLSWYSAANAYLGETIVSAAAVAGAWQYLEVVGDPATVAGAAKATVALGESGTPAATDAYYVDNAELRIYNADTGLRLAAGLASGATFNDWGAASGVDYEYRLITKGSNGTTVTGPWTG